VRAAGLMLAAGLLGLAATAPPLRAAETALAAPWPSWEAPRQIILQLTDGEPRTAGNLLSNAVNLQKFYGQDLVKVAIIAYGDGVKAMLAGTSPVQDRIASLQQYDVEFVACGNTLAATGKTEADLLPGVKVVTAGIAEITERRLKGWIYIAP